MNLSPLSRGVCGQPGVSSFSSKGAHHWRNAARIAGLGLCWALVAGWSAAASPAPAAARAAAPPQAASSSGTQTGPSLPLLPYPREITEQGGELHLTGPVSIAVNSNSAQDRFAAESLAGELEQIDHLRSDIRQGSEGTVILARADSTLGKQLLRESGETLPAAADQEGYVLVVTPQRAFVVAKTSAGVYYGVQTLRQLIHPGGNAAANASAVRIVDWPALRWRGVSIDISRGAIPTLAAFKRDIELFSEMKINLFSIYFENTFQYTAFPNFSAPGGAVTPEEAREIVAYGQKHHVLVVPEQESFGHVHLGLEAQKFQSLDELPFGDVLTPVNPGSIKMIAAMFKEINEVFPGPFFHVGADETFELGEGQSHALLEKEGAGLLYLNYLKQIDQMLQPYHRKVLFWGDIAYKHPALLKQLPESMKKNMIAIPWVYGPLNSYVRFIKPFTDAGMQCWVAPGVNNWSRIYPNFHNAIVDITNFVRDGRSLGCTGELNTNWNDDGESFFDYTWYGIGYGAAVGWENVPSLDRFNQAYDWALYRADGHAFLQQVQTMDKIHALLEKTIHMDGEDSIMWHRAFSPRGQAFYKRLQPAAAQMRLLAEDVIASLAHNRDHARRLRSLLIPVSYAAYRFDYVGQKALYANYIATLYHDASTHSSDKGLVRRTLGRIDSVNGLLQDMRDKTTNLRGQYKEAWLEGNTPYFLANMMLKYRTEELYWQHQIDRFNQIRADYRSTGQLPPLVTNWPFLPPAANGSPQIVPTAAH